MKSARTLVFASTLAVTVCVIGCRGRSNSPTGPSDTQSPATGTPPSSMPSPTNGETFAVTGVVTDDLGAPIAGVPVTMSHWLGGRVFRPTVLTDASGHYAIEFSSNPWTNTSGRWTAKAEIITEDYDW